MRPSSGANFRKALRNEKPLQIVGAINAYTAIMAEKIGHRALYLSGAGCANMSYGLPDLGLTNLSEVLEDARRITSATPLPLLVDIDTGWGSPFNIARTVKEMINAGVAAVHIEDQSELKRCGHRPNKTIVSQSEMLDRIKSAVDARYDESFFIIARTDAYASEGIDAAIERINLCIEAGADGIFAEAVESLDDYKKFKQCIDAPLLANMTEFGRTPFFTKQEFSDAGVDMILYPLTAARAMNKAAETVYKTLIEKGDQTDLISTMQTREELYDYLDYMEFERKIDKMSEKKNQ